MSRVSDGWDDDGPSFPNEYELREANLQRAIHGKRGRKVFEDMETALLAMPRKAIVEGVLAKDGLACSVGALVAWRRSQREGRPIFEVLSDMEAETRGCTCDHVMAAHIDGVCRGCTEYRAHVRLNMEAGGGWGKPRSFHEHVEAAYREPLGYSWSALRPPMHAYEPADELPDHDEEDYDGADLTLAAAVAVGVSRPLAYHLMYQNDGVYDDMTPEQRYDKLLAYVRARLRAA